MNSKSQSNYTAQNTPHILFFSLLILTSSLIYCNAKSPFLFSPQTSDLQMLSWTGTQSNDAANSNYWVATCDSSLCNYLTGGSSHSLGEITTWKCTNWNDKVCLSWNGIQSTNQATVNSWRCNNWKGSYCIEWTGEGQQDGNSGEVMRWNCNRWHNQSCESWIGTKTMNLGNSPIWTCDAWIDKSCSQFSGLQTQNSGKVYAWRVSGLSAVFIFTNSQEIQIGSPLKPNWSSSVSVVGSGVCNFSFPHADALTESVALFNASNASAQFLLNGSELIWNCSDGVYRVEWMTPEVTINESWTQDTTKQSNLSSQFLIGTIVVANPAQEDYTNVSFATSPPNGFIADSEVIIPLLKAGEKQTFVAHASGNVLAVTWTGFGEHPEKESIVASRAWTAEGITVQNSANVSLVNIAANWNSLSGWNCTAPLSIDLSPIGSYVNSSFVECSANALTLNESNWNIDSSKANSIDAQYFLKKIQVKNGEAINFSRVSMTLVLPPQSLKAITGNYSWTNLSVTANGKLELNASIEGDWTDQTLSNESDSKNIWTQVQISNTTEGITNISCSLSLPRVEGGTEFLQLSSNGRWTDLTPFTTCPTTSSFTVNGTVWQSCGIDLDSDGYPNQFKIIVPHFSTWNLRAGGLIATTGNEQLPGSNLEKNTTIITSESNSTPTATPISSAKPANNSEIEVSLPTEMGFGIAHGQVTENGKAAGGAVEIISPSGKRYVRILGIDGSFDFYFDEEGNWQIKYKNTLKEIRVSREPVPSQETILINETNEQEKQQQLSISSGTGLFAAAASNWSVLIGLLAIIALGILAGKGLVLSGRKLTKTFKKGIITIEVSAGKDDLKNLVLTDVIPEGAQVMGLDVECSQKDTVIGIALKWRKKELGKGQKWKIEYVLSGAKEKLRPAEIKAETKKGQIVLISEEVEA